MCRMLFGWMGRGQMPERGWIGQNLRGSFSWTRLDGLPPLPSPRKPTNRSCFQDENSKCRFIFSRDPSFRFQGSMFPRMYNKFTKYLENFWNQGRKKLGAGVRSILYPPTARYCRLRINPIDTDTQSLTCNPSQNEGYKKEFAPSRYRHMTSGSIFKIFFVNVSKGVTFLPLHLLLSARFRVQLAACPGDLENITMEDGCSAWFDLASSAFCCRSWELGGNFKMPQIHGSLYAQLKTSILVIL